MKLDIEKCICSQVNVLHYTSDRAGKQGADANTKE